MSTEIVTIYSRWTTRKLQQHMQAMHSILNQRGAVTSVREPQPPVKQLERKECPDHLGLEPMDGDPMEGVNIHFRNL